MTRTARASRGGRVAHAYRRHVRRRLPASDVRPRTGGSYSGRLGGALAWDAFDAHRRATGLAVLVLVAGGALAVAGLPPVDLHGPLHRVGIMDPACGMTRATRLLFRGDLAGATAYNPASIALGVAAALLAVRALVGGITHRWLNLRWHRARPLALPVAAVALAVLEIRQQLQAGLLETPGATRSIGVDVPISADAAVLAVLAALAVMSIIAVSWRSGEDQRGGTQHQCDRSDHAREA